MLTAPPPLRPGDVVAVVAPSSPFDPALVWRGLGWLAERYRVRFDRGLFSREGYLAGHDSRREDELRRAMTDPDVRAIVTARGGYGLNRFVHRLDWARFAREPKWITGFSDITALHVEAQRAGVMSLHACHVTALGRSDDPARRAFVEALEDPLRARAFDDLQVVQPGEAMGPLVGGNLTLIATCATAGRLAIPRGAVLFVEDVTERPYRVDRMLSALEAGGYFDELSAVLVGEFVGCGPGPDGVSVDQVLAERFGRLGVPLVAGLPVGHGTRNAPLTLGAYARVKAGEAGRVEVGAAAGFG